MYNSKLVRKLFWLWAAASTKQTKLKAGQAEHHHSSAAEARSWRRQEELRAHAGQAHAIGLSAGACNPLLAMPPCMAMLNFGLCACYVIHIVELKVRIHDTSNYQHFVRRARHT
jgi:hypothetical protein